MQAVTAGSLEAIITPRYEHSKPDRHVILLHGFGAPGTDLVGLEHSIETKVDTQFIYLQAPHYRRRAAEADQGWN